MREMAEDGACTRITVRGLVVGLYINSERRCGYVGVDVVMNRRAVTCWADEEHISHVSVR